MGQKSISRDAEVVAYCLFLTGKPARLTFARPHIIHPRTRAALDELVSVGMVEPIPAGELPPGSAGWQATDAIGSPMRDIRRPTKADSFPITTE